MEIKTVFTAFRNRLLAGIFVATPLVATIWLLKIAYDFIAQVSRPLLMLILERFEQNQQVLDGFERGEHMQWLSFLITLLLVFLLGLLATNVIGKRLIEWTELLIMRIPIAATIYTGIKQIMDSVSQFRGKMQFKRVAYIQYPSDECRLIGFVTGQFYDDEREEDMTCVFIPTSPNPMTGFVIVVPNRKIIEANLTMEQASKLILSAGLVGPRFPMPADDGKKQGISPGEPPYPQQDAEDEDEQHMPPLPHAVRAAQRSSGSRPAHTTRKRPEDPFSQQ
jgi:uncharacterized membrane protein